MCIGQSNEKKNKRREKHIKKIAFETATTIKTMKKKVHKYTLTVCGAAFFSYRLVFIVTIFQVYAMKVIMGMYTTGTT